MRFFKRQKNLNTFILAFNAKFEGIRIEKIIDLENIKGNTNFNFKISSAPKLIELTHLCSEQQYELVRYDPELKKFAIRKL